MKRLFALVFLASLSGLLFANAEAPRQVCAPGADLADRLTQVVQSGLEVYGSAPALIVFEGTKLTTLLDALHKWDGDPTDITEDAGADKITYVYMAQDDGTHQVPQFMVVSKGACITNVYVAANEYFNKFLDHVFHSA
jgi:hypothetical protein